MYSVALYSWIGIIAASPGREGVRGNHVQSSIKLYTYIFIQQTHIQNNSNNNVSFVSYPIVLSRCFYLRLYRFSYYVLLYYSYYDNGSLTYFGHSIERICVYTVYNIVILSDYKNFEVFYKYIPIYCIVETAPTK